MPPRLTGRRSFMKNERQCSLRRAWEGKTFRSAAIFTGPEGGLTEAEVAQARAAGMAVCTLVAADFALRDGPALRPVGADVRRR